jgi:hypothetical protein
MNQLYLEVDAVLRHLEIKELQRNFGVAEARLVGSKKAFAHATQSLTIKLKDLKDFMRPDTQKCRLDMIVNMPGFGRPNLEANIREAEENIALFEDLLPVRTEAEQKAKLNECVAELAGEPYFQDLLKFVKTVNEVFALFDQINNAWAVQKPYLFAKLMTYVSLKSDMEKIMPLLPQRSARKFGFCFADVLLSGAKIILPEVLLKEFPDLRQACAEEIQMCRQSIVGYRARQAEMELRDRQSELLRTIGRDIQELETLCLNSSESKEAIAALEEREYTLTGTMILRERFRNVPQDHPINQMLGQLGEAELEEAQAGFGKALRALDAERSVLFNTIRMQPSAKALLE